MDYKQLENLNKESLAQIEEYLKSKGQLKEDEQRSREGWYCRF